MTAHIFNPETDIILGLDTSRYTPPKHVKNMMQTLALLPALYASTGDLIIASSPFHNLPFHDITVEKGLKILNMEQFSNLVNSSEIPLDQIEINPWGWNREIRKRLLDTGIPSYMVPTDNAITKLRKLSSRETTISFFQNNRDNIPNTFSTPVKLSDMEEAAAYIDSCIDFCIKAPWSSSGRGLLFSQTLSREKTLEWIYGVIRSQGFAIGEKKYIRKLDFASEWFVEDGIPVFIGFSIFSSSNRGKYQGNLILPQKKLNERIIKECRWTDGILKLQKEFISSMISNEYSGPVGIDMLATPDGEINPCVEINLRHTMGHVAIEISNVIKDLSCPILSSLYRKYCPENFMDLKKILLD